MTSGTIQAEAKIIAMYQKYPTQIIRVLSYTGNDTVTKNIVNYFELYGDILATRGERAISAD